MKFDPALKAAVRDRAPAGLIFDSAEIDTALQWAYDVRVSGRSRLDEFYRDTPLGRAAAGAVHAYRPEPPKPATRADVALRLIGFAFAGWITVMIILGVTALVARVAGGHLELNWWGLSIAGYLVWFPIAWLARERIHLLEPTPNRYTPVPAQRAGGHDLGSPAPDPVAKEYVDQAGTPEVRR